MSNGKGDLRRPAQIPPDEFAKRWELTFRPPRCPLCEHEGGVEAAVVEKWDLCLLHRLEAAK